MKKKRTNNLRASTLSEILVVMMLTGIIVVGVFDGFSLFQRLLFRIQGKVERSIDRIEAYYRLESLFAGSDSIRGEITQLELYRQGWVREQIRIEDSLLIVTRPESDRIPDTLLRKVSDPVLVRHPDLFERIDSLLIFDDTVRLYLGIRSRPEVLAEETAKKTEEYHRHHENR